MLHIVVGGVHLVSEDPGNLYTHQISLQFHVLSDDERESERECSSQEDKAKFSMYSHTRNLDIFEGRRRIE